MFQTTNQKWLFPYSSEEYLEIYWIPVHNRCLFGETINCCWLSGGPGNSPQVKLKGRSSSQNGHNKIESTRLRTSLGWCLNACWWFHAYWGPVSPPLKDWCLKQTAGHEKVHHLYGKKHGSIHQPFISWPGARLSPLPDGRPITMNLPPPLFHSSNLASQTAWQTWCLQQQHIASYQTRAGHALW